MKKYLFAAACLALVGFMNFGRARAQTDLPATDPTGSNVAINGTVYYIQAPPQGGAVPVDPPPPTLTAYPSATVFLSYGFNSWKNVLPASAADKALAKNGQLMPYADGSLVNDNGTVYVISGGARYGIASVSVFLGLGYQWANVLSGNTTFLAKESTITSVGQHLPGTLMRQNSTIYYVTNYGKTGFPSLAVFNSWGFNLKNVVASNSGDESLGIDPYSEIVETWSLGQLSPAISPLKLIPQAN